MMNETFNLDHHILSLLQDEPFFAALSRRIDKTASTAVPTAGVRVNPHTAQFELLYNPEFMGALKDEHQLGVLADGQHLLDPVLDVIGHHRWLGQDHSTPLDVDQCVGGAQIDC